MSRRSGQNGSVETRGNSLFLRFWVDVPGQHKRQLKSVKIGPVSMGKVARAQAIRKILDEYRVNDPDRLQELLAEGCAVTFETQSLWWLEHIQTRKRRPIKPHTASTFRSHLNWINQHIGSLSLAHVNNKSVKDLIAKMVDTGFSPKTIRNYLGVVKAVVASAVDENGEQIYPRKWNHEFLDLPEVEKQNTPSCTAEQVSKIIQQAEGQERVLFALLAGTGLRVGEALALEIYHFKGSFLEIQQTLWHNKLQTPKTRNGYREVDLTAPLARMLRKLIGARTAGFIFCTPSGSPLRQSNILRRDLHPILESLGLTKAGFHVFRRFRITHLRKQRASEDLIQYWVGHANKSVTDAYSKIRDDREYRQQACEQVGVGFDPFDLYEMYENRVSETDEQVGLTA